MIDIHLKNFEDRERKRFISKRPSSDYSYQEKDSIDDFSFDPVDFEDDIESEELRFEYPKNLLDENASFSADSYGNLIRVVWEEIEKIEMQYNELSSINYGYYLYWINNEPIKRSPKDFVKNQFFSKYYDEKLDAFNSLIAYYSTGFYFMGIYSDLNWLIETFNQLFIKTKEKCRSLEIIISDYDFYKMKNYGDLFDDDKLIESEFINEYLKYYLTLYSYKINGRLLYKLKDYSRMITEIQNDFFSYNIDQNSDEYVFNLTEIFTDKHKVKANDYLNILVINGFASESEWIQPHYTSRIFYEEMRNRGIMKAIPFKLAVKYFNSKYDNFSGPSFVKPVDFTVDPVREYKELIALEIDLVK